MSSLRSVSSDASAPPSPATPEALGAAEDPFSESGSYDSEYENDFCSERGDSPDKSASAAVLGVSRDGCADADYGDDDFCSDAGEEDAAHEENDDFEEDVESRQDVESRRDVESRQDAESRRSSCSDRLPSKEGVISLAGVSQRSSRIGTAGDVALQLTQDLAEHALQRLDYDTRCEAEPPLAPPEETHASSSASRAGSASRSSSCEPRLAPPERSVSACASPAPVSAQSEFTGMVNAVVNDALDTSWQMLFPHSPAASELVSEHHSACGFLSMEPPPEAPPENDHLTDAVGPPPLAPPEEDEEAEAPPEHIPAASVDEDMPRAPLEKGAGQMEQMAASLTRDLNIARSTYHDGPVCYPGLDDLLNDPSFQCREEWRRKLVPAKRETDEPLTFQRGANGHHLGHGRVGAVGAQSQQPRATGRSRRSPSPCLAPAAAPATEALRPLIGPRTLRATPRPVREALGATPPPPGTMTPRAPSPTLGEFSITDLVPRPPREPSQRAKEFSRCYLPSPREPPQRISARVAVRKKGAKLTPREHSGFSGDVDNRVMSSLPPLPGGDHLGATALQAWCTMEALTRRAA